MPLEQKEISIVTKKIMGVSEFGVSSKLAIDPEKPLKRVLNITAIADIANSQVIDTDYTISGRTQITLLYVTEAESIESITTFAEWQNTVKVMGENLSAAAKVNDITVDTFTATEVNISMLHNIVAEGTETQSIMPENNLPEDAVTDNTAVEYTTVAGASSQKFIVSENIDIANNITEVLCTDASATISNCVAGIDQITVEGILDLKFLCKTTEGTVQLSKQIEYKQEVSCLGTLADYLTEAKITVCSVNATAEQSDKSNLVVACNLLANVTAYKKVLSQVTKDVFSLSKKLDTTTDCVSHCDFVAQKFVKDTVVCSQNFDNIFVDETIATVAPTIKLAKFAIVCNKLEVEGVMSCTLIYKNNQSETTLKEQLNFPFVTKIDIDCNATAFTDNVSVNITGTKVRSGSEVEVVFDLLAPVSIISENYFEYIKSAVVTGEEQSSDYGVTIYVTKQNETVFEVARALKVLPEQITNQNQIENGKFAAGQRVFVYNPLNAEF